MCYCTGQTSESHFCEMIYNHGTEVVITHDWIDQTFKTQDQQQLLNVTSSEFSACGASSAKTSINMLNLVRAASTIDFKSTVPVLGPSPHEMLGKLESCFTDWIRNSATKNTVPTGSYGMIIDGPNTSGLYLIHTSNWAESSLSRCII